MKEIWMDIKNYEGLYQASNLGNIRTFPNKITCNQNNVKRCWKSRVMKGRGDSHITGKRVDLWKEGVHKSFLVARLVAFTFLNEDINNHELTVNHKNGNRLDNNINNLELISLADNIRHAFNTGLMPYNKIKLYNNTENLIFNSMTLASKFLDRSGNYVSQCIKKHRRIKSKIGIEYLFQIVKRDKK